MAPLQVHSKRSYASVYAVLAFVIVMSFADLMRHEMKTVEPTLPALFVGYALIAFWVKSIQGMRQVEIDTLLNKVTVRTVSAFFSPRAMSYPLDMFGSVRSYVTFGRFTTNAVELVTKPGGEALLVASFSPSNGANSFWSTPTESENKEAAILRREIAAYAGLRDQGFLNTKLVGAQLKDWCA